MVSTITLTRWEYRRLWNYLRTSIRRPIFLTVQIVSMAIIGLILWVLWFLMLSPIGLPEEIRGSLYQILYQSGLLGPNAVVIVYALLSLIIAQQIVKAIIGVPLGSESEPADVDFLFPAPIQGRVFYTAKYFRSIPRRILFFFYIIVAFQPVIWWFWREYNAFMLTLPIFIFVAFLLGEIGSIATHALYALRKFVSQHRSFQRIYRIIFYIALILGTFLILTPLLIVGGAIVNSPMYNLAYLLVALGSCGNFAPLYVPAIPGVLIGLIIAYILILVIARWLSDKITIDLYEEITTMARRQGTALGSLSRIPIKFQPTKTPLRAILKKDFITGLRKPGKAFFIVGIIANFVFAIIFIGLLPTFHILFSLPSSFLPFMEPLYAILLVVILPLLAITASDPFQSEYGTIYLIRLGPVPPLQFTFIKYIQLVLTPLLLSIPFTIYFAVILGSLALLPIAVAILPHAILISTAIGVGLGSRYPYVTRAKTETPVALMITYPVLSWLAIIPVLVFELGFLQAGIPQMLFSSMLIVPYTMALMLILLSWSAHSYLRQE